MSRDAAPELALLPRRLVVRVEHDKNISASVAVAASGDV
jgi:hypothetical protein